MLHHSSASFPTELLPHLCDVKQSYCFLFKTLALGAITGKKGSWGSFISRNPLGGRVLSFLPGQGAAPAFTLLQGHLTAQWPPPPCSKYISLLHHGHLLRAPGTPLHCSRVTTSLLTSLLPVALSSSYSKNEANAASS